MNEKRLQTYASIAEVVSAFAVIVSLLYVGYEVRRTSTMSSREADAVLYERLRDANELLIETPHLAELLAGTQTAPEELSAADHLRLMAFDENFFQSWELGWYYHEDGILTDASWREWDNCRDEVQLRRMAAAVQRLWA